MAAGGPGGNQFLLPATSVETLFATKKREELRIHRRDSRERGTGDASVTILHGFASARYPMRTKFVEKRSEIFLDKKKALRFGKYER